VKDLTNIAAGLLKTQSRDTLTRTRWILPGDDINRLPEVNNIERVGTNFPGGIPKALVG